MTKSIDEYKTAFREAFGIESDVDVAALEYESISEWDSIGHMGLMAELEDRFGINFETDDIVGFSSYKVGIEILKKYGITIG
jgi:acyl carrier protein